MLRYPILIFLLSSYYLHAPQPIGLHYPASPPIHALLNIGLLWINILAYSIGLYGKCRLPAYPLFLRGLWIIMLLSCLILSFTQQLWLFLIAMILLSMSCAMRPVYPLSFVPIILLAMSAILSAWSIYNGGDWRSVFIVLALLAGIGSILDPLQPNAPSSPLPPSPTLSYIFMIYTTLLLPCYFIYLSGMVLLISLGAMGYVSVQAYYGTIYISKQHRKLWMGVELLHIFCWGIMWVIR